MSTSPHVAGVKAIWSPNTGIIDFTKVSEAYSTEMREGGGDLITNAEVRSISRSNGSIHLETTAGDMSAKSIINCAGLHADKVAGLMGVDIGVRIIPFRGEYFSIRPERASLVKGLVYPGARFHFALPGSPLHEADQRVCRGRAERGARVEARGLFQDQLCPGRRARHPDLPRLLEDEREILADRHERAVPLDGEVGLREVASDPGAGDKG